MNKNENEQQASLADRFKAYKAGEGDMPVIRKSGEVSMLMNEEKRSYKVILTEELVDRDGETVLIKGMTLPKNGIPFIDRHDMNGSVIATRLGTVKNIRIEGNKIVGDIVLVNTMAGREIQAILDDPEHPFAVSMGFGVMDYDMDSREIKEWELFELSAVNVPANVGAHVLKTIKEEQEDFEKKLNHYKTIEPVHREVVKSFLSDSFCKEIAYQKTGNMIIDIANIFEVLSNKLKSSEVATPQATTDKVIQKNYKLSDEATNKLVESIATRIVNSL